MVLEYLIPHYFSLLLFLFIIYYFSHYLFITYLFISHIFIYYFSHFFIIIIILLTPEMFSGDRGAEVTRKPRDSPEVTQLYSDGGGTQVISGLV